MLSFAVPSPAAAPVPVLAYHPGLLSRRDSITDRARGVNRPLARGGHLGWVHQSLGGCPLGSYGTQAPATPLAWAFPVVHPLRSLHAPARPICFFGASGRSAHLLRLQYDSRCALSVQPARFEDQRRPANQSKAERSRGALGPPVYARWRSQFGHFLVTPTGVSGLNFLALACAVSRQAEPTWRVGSSKS